MGHPGLSGRVRQRRWFSTAGLVALYCAVVAAAFFHSTTCSGTPPSDGTEVPNAPRNLVLVSLDTLRADHLGAYGYGRDTSPVLDRFGRDAIVILDAVSASNETIASHHALFQSKLPARALADAAEAPTLAAVLRHRGWRTAAFTDGGPMSPLPGFARGFDHFDFGNRGLVESLPKALAWIDANGGEPFYLFLHSFDIHHPYDPGPPWDSRFRTASSESLAGADTKKLLEAARGRTQRGVAAATPGLSQADRTAIEALYDGGIAKTDALLGQLFEKLGAPELLDDTIVVVLSDHGEEFWDHDGVLHSHTLYQELLHVPVLLRVPGWSPRRVDTRVSLLDVTPTLLEILGVPRPRSMRGTSLVPLLRDGSGSARVVLSEGVAGGTYLQSVIEGRFKLIRRSHEPSAPLELYDLVEDPGEQTNLAGAQPAIRRHLRGLLDAAAVMPANRPHHPLDEPQRLDPETRERLRELGYLE